MKRRNKKGSSLVMVVFVTAIIFMVGTVMLALVQTDYKSRMQRSQSIKSLYAADSGLNIVKNAINKEAEAAMFCAANQVKQDINGGNYKFLADGGVINKDKYAKINNIFKYYFITELTSNDVNADSNFSSISESDIKLETQPLCYAAKEKKYNTYGNDSDKACSISDLKSEKKDVIGDTNNEGKNATITIEGINVKRYGDVSPSELKKYRTDNDTDKEYLKNKLEKIEKNGDCSNYIKIKVTSTFKSEHKGTKTKGTKKITTTFTINAPDYDESLTASSKKVDLIKYPFLRAITCDGNLVYNPSDSKKNNRYGVTVNGSVWVKGELEDKGDESKKYDSGIIVDGGKFKVKGLKDIVKTEAELKEIGIDEDDENYTGNIFCNGSVSLIRNCNVDLPNVYARNVYSGTNTNYTKGGSDINLDVNGNVTTNNDLVINSSNTEVNINGSYYGINDVNGVKDSFENSSDSSNETAETAKTRRASSIIINKDEDNNLNIKDDAYINGVAFLDINKDDGTPSGKIYGTGESIAVQGNYKAYTEVLPNEDATLEYYDAYTLIGGSVDKKAKHFDEFYKNKKASNGGVEINGNLYAIGASAQKDKKYNITECQDTINSLKKDYAKKVLLMNYPLAIAGIDEESQLYEIYNKYDVSRSVVNSNAENSVVNFDKYIEDCKANKVENPEKVLVTGDDEGKIFKHNYYKTLFDCNENDNIIIKNDGVYIDGDKKIDIISEKTDDDNEIKLIKAVILTKGNVIFDSSDEDINYLGTVVAGGNVTMKGNHNINVTFNKKQVQYALAEQKLVYPSIEAALDSSYFIKSQKDGSEVAGTLLTAEGKYEPSYNSKLLKEGFWKLGA